MIRATIATAAFTVCCLGNPAGAQTLTTSPHSHIQYSPTTSIADDQINHTGHTYNNRQRTYTGDVDRSRTVDRSVDNSGNSRGNTNSYNTTTRNVDRSRTRNVDQSFDYSTITNEPVQHAPIPALPGPAAPDSVSVLSLYTQYTEGAGQTTGAAISIPLKF